MALAYFDAFSRKRFERLADLLHPDVEFKGPGGSLHNSRDFIATLRKVAPVLLRTDLKRVFVEGDEALVRYDFVTDTPVGPVPTVEMLKIESGRVRSIWLLFDRQVWNAVLAARSNDQGGPSDIPGTALRFQPETCMATRRGASHAEERADSRLHPRFQRPAGQKVL